MHYPLLLVLAGDSECETGHGCDRAHLFRLRRHFTTAHQQLGGVGDRGSPPNDPGHRVLW